MECNKDEAVRAKAMAEKKMENNDFEGARKIVKKAQNLYPELENVNQLLSICDVHCSAQKSVLGPDKDWYGILQVEKLADELTVKKQYRRLALFLHPDKNRFPGAEAAFKLICEANAVLSDPTKKSVYDSKIRKPAPPHHMNKTSQLNKQHGAQNKFSHVFTSLNQHQATKSVPFVRPGIFWTSCPFCSIRFQYDRQYVNTNVKCQKCFKNFITYEIGAHDIPLGSKWGPQSAQQMPARRGATPFAGFQENGVPNQSKFPMGVRNPMGSSAAPHVQSQSNASGKTVRPEPSIQTESVFKSSQNAAKVSRDLKAKGTYNSNVNSSHGSKEGPTSKGDARDLKNKSKKRGRKRVVESSESSASSSTESDLEDVTIKMKFGSDPTTNLNSESSYAHFPRRSSRRRQNVSYNEGGYDDIPSSRKEPQESKSSEDNGHEEKDVLDGEHSKNDSKSGSQNGFSTDADFPKPESKEMGTVQPEESVNNKNADASHDKEVKASAQAGSKSDAGADAIEIESDSDMDSHSIDTSDTDLCQCDDPEFNDFDKDRDENCFAVNQFWACYDQQDGMPRFYAKVRKVRVSPFELSITWLEPDSTDEAKNKWIDAKLPVGCGSFKLATTEKTSLRLSFSHQVRFERGIRRGSLVIYPRKGEIWAVFKHYDLSWIVEPEDHQEYKYEVVEVLSDFDAGAGANVCYLDKVGGFVSLFQQSSKNDRIEPSDLYKFSHRIPCFKMTGSERPGVPVGCFELDPASLPLNPDHLYYPGKAKMETEETRPGDNCAPKKEGQVH